MARGIQGPGKPFAIAVLACAAMALAPAAWLRPWTTDVSDLLWLPLRPAAHGLTALRHWLRPGQQPDRGGGDAELLSQERDRFRSLWHAERLRAEELAQRLAQLERAERFHRGNTPVVPRMVSVTGRGVGRSELMLSLQAGTREGGRPGDPAVIGGDLLVGRVVGEPTDVTCWLAPLQDPSTGRLDVYVVPADRPEAPPSESALAQLRPDGRGALVGEAEASASLVPGDVVRLADPTWKPAAQGMRVGVVQAVRPSDRNPLRAVVEVRCGVEPERLREVTLKVERAE